MEKQEIKDNLSDCGQWKRLVYMLLFAMILYLTMMVLGLVVLVQVIFSLVTGQTNDNIQSFSKDLATYIHQIVLFLSYNDNRKPYPFNPLQQQDDFEESEDEIDEHITGIDDASNK